MQNIVIILFLMLIIQANCIESSYGKEIISGLSNEIGNRDNNYENCQDQLINFKSLFKSGNQIDNVCNIESDNKFVLTKVIFKGNSVFDTEQLQKYCCNYLGKEVFLEELTAITQKITTLYQNKGFKTSIAFITPKPIENGIIEITIIESNKGRLFLRKNNKQY